MDNIEMRTLQETSRVVEKLADFAGSVILQLMQKQGYVEKQGIRALLEHIRRGGTTLTSVVSDQRAEAFKELLKKEHIPYVEIEHVDPKTKERSVFFVYRDCDRTGVKEVVKQFEISLDQACHEVDVDTFLAMMDKKPCAAVYGLTRAEVYAFREAAKEYHLDYCMVADGSGYAVVGSDKGALEKVICDMCYNLSGERGKAYERALQEYFQSQDSFVERMKPEAGRVKYIVSGKHPQNFLTVDDQGITAHSIGTRQERGADGTMKDVVYDVRHVTYPGFDREKLKTLALELQSPVILSQEEFPLVTGLSRTKEAVLSADFVEQYGAFKKQMESRRADLTRVPKRKPLYAREDVIGYSNIPIDVLQKLIAMDLPQVYIDGSDVAYPKEMEDVMRAFWEQELYSGLSQEEKERERERYESGGTIQDRSKQNRVDREDMIQECGNPIQNREENAALEYMLSIEAVERSVLRAGGVQPELLNEVQKEAMERMGKKEIREQTMSREMAKLLQDQMRDRRIQQEIER
ncbi:MAG: hypothetical protein SPG09_06875 [Lachnospiraceae bacterium]|nr:hypothetical protein [bacterium]MDY5517316.1 hypothetical protein [Lachnospiraceae bacterium]